MCAQAAQTVAATQQPFVGKQLTRRGIVVYNRRKNNPANCRVIFAVSVQPSRCAVIPPCGIVPLPFCTSGSTCQRPVYGIFKRCPAGIGPFYAVGVACLDILNHAAWLHHPSILNAFNSSGNSGKRFHGKLLAHQPRATCAGPRGRVLRSAQGLLYIFFGLCIAFSIEKTYPHDRKNQSPVP